MEPKISPSIQKLLNAGQDLEVLRAVVDRMWPLKREWEAPRGTSSIALHLEDPSSGLELTALIVTASGSRSGDISLSLLDTSNAEGLRDRVIRESVNRNVFSRTFFLTPGDSPRTTAIFNSLCLIADSLERESRPAAPGHIEKNTKSLEVGAAEDVIQRAITKPIDFSGAFSRGMPRLYCDDTELLANNTPTAWVDFSLSADGKILSLIFSQRIDGREYNPYLPTICLREPIQGGSRYRGVRVHGAFKVLFAVDGIFPPPAPTSLTLPPLKEA